MCFTSLTRRKVAIIRIRPNENFIIVDKKVKVRSLEVFLTCAKDGPPRPELCLKKYSQRFSEVFRSCWKFSEVFRAYEV
jgi:hypothetical protein